jgi:hypothetical protein
LELLAPPQVLDAEGVSGPPVQLACVAEPETVPDAGFDALRGAHGSAATAITNAIRNALSRRLRVMMNSSLLGEWINRKRSISSQEM